MKRNGSSMWQSRKNAWGVVALAYCHEEFFYAD